MSGRTCLNIIRDSIACRSDYCDHKNLHFSGLKAAFLCVRLRTEAFQISVTTGLANSVTTPGRVDQVPSDQEMKAITCEIIDNIDTQRKPPCSSTCHVFLLHAIKSGENDAVIFYGSRCNPSQSTASVAAHLPEPGRLLHLPKLPSEVHRPRELTEGKVKHLSVL